MKIAIFGLKAGLAGRPLKPRSALEHPGFDEDASLVTCSGFPPGILHSGQVWPWSWPCRQPLPDPGSCRTVGLSLCVPGLHCLVPCALARKDLGGCVRIGYTLRRPRELICTNQAYDAEYRPHRIPASVIGVEPDLESRSPRLPLQKATGSAMMVKKPNHLR